MNLSTAALGLQAVILALLATLTLAHAPASVIVNVSGQTISVATPTGSTTPGVVGDFAHGEGTGGWARAQEMPQIVFQPSELMFPLSERVNQ